MKKLMFLLVLSVCAMTVFAQDIIIKRDATKVEAVITEVSGSEVKYKSYTNQEGPTFILSSDEIATIMYKNGEVQVFEKKVEPTPNYGYRLTGPMAYVDGFYYLNNKLITKTQLREHLMNNCKTAYNYYKKYSDMAIAGVALLGAGAGLDIIGIILSATGNRDGVTGLVITTLGSASTIAGVPLCAIGFIRRRRVYHIYNSRCANTAFRVNKEVNLNVQASGDGVGLALRF